MRFTKNLNARALRRSVIIGAIVAVLILAAGTASPSPSRRPGPPSR